MDSGQRNAHPLGKMKEVITIYPNIAAERARRSMSLGDLAGSLGVSRKTLYNWEGSGNIPAAALIKMSELFSCSIDYLLSQDLLPPVEYQKPCTKNVTGKEVE